ncbi:PEP-CTERM sorting domain-containing protein [Polaromonas sp. UC242_47]|uniref:PEP-CTERM sorting domain-containing protein n=1 Tax=Polaromonas sp. UC242_47 TaxID=3374626 RepID=UPI00379B0CCF
MKKIKQILAATALVLGFSVAHAGPIIIAGTDMDDHGFFSGGANQTGWKFMQLAMSNIGGAVSNGQTNAVCIGCNGSQASAAFSSAFSLAGLTGWTSTQLTSTTDITNFFNNTGAVNLSNAGFIYMPTVANNVTGGINDIQLAVVNLNGTAINNYLAAGGGLFTQEQANSSIGYGWLTSLLPTLVVKGDNSGGIANSGELQLTVQGNAQFPGLTNTDISNATPWHAYFEGGFGALQSLIVGNGNNFAANILDDTVVLGGGFAGGGGVIVCGQPNQPPCDPNNVPEPDSLPLVLAALGGLYLAQRKKSNAV